jgi:hypothetical protein
VDLTAKMLRISSASVLKRALIVNTNARVKTIHVVDMLFRIQATDRVGLFVSSGKGRVKCAKIRA